MRWRQTLDVLSTIAVTAAAGAIVYSVAHSPKAARNGNASPKVPATPQSIAGAPVAGSATARVAIIEYSDFQCPYCAKFVSDTMPTIKKEFVEPGLVQFVFMDFPLDAIHPYARKAAVLAGCAARQGRFWEMHDLLFRNHNRLSEDLLALGSEAGLQEDSTRICVEQASAESIDASIAHGRELGLSGTPAFLIGKRSGDTVFVSNVMVGFKTADELRAVITPLLAVEKQTASLVR